MINGSRDKAGVDEGESRMIETEQLTIESEREDDTHVVTLHGELDLSNAPMLDAEMQRVDAGDAKALVLDLRGLEFIDLAGVATLLKAEARSRRDANRLSFLRPPPHVQEVLDLTDVTTLLPFTD
jgi:anti-sigma B factor antagonist